MAGLGGLQVSSSGHLPASVEACKDGFRTPWQARRARPEAVPVCKRRDPPVPVTGITGTGQGARPSANGTARPSRGCTGRTVSGCADQASRQNSSWEGSING